MTKKPILTLVYRRNVRTPAANNYSSCGSSRL